MIRVILALALAAAAPAAQGDSTQRFDATRAELAARKSAAFLVVRHGKVLYEWYAPGRTAAQQHFEASLTKALVGGMSLALALNDGRIGVDDLASRYIPEWKNDPRKAKITIRHLATHSSGIEDAEQDGKPHEVLPGWKGAFWRREPDPFSLALRAAPVLFEPGSKYAYSNPGMAALAYAVTASLWGAPQTDIRQLLRERVTAPLGIADADWSIGYGRAYELDGLELYANWGGSNWTPRAVARVGELMLGGGAWNGRRLLDAQWVKRVTSDAGTPRPNRSRDPAPASGLCWYVNSDGVWPAVPRDAFAGAGAQHQVLLVVPSLGLIVVRNGQPLSATPGDGFWGPVVRYVFNPVVEAVRAAGPPYPASPVIRGVRFAPAASIVRDAAGSDNWPLTWGDDYAQYTSYGDGWGFEPRTERKLSQGFARIDGPATAFHGTNIRSPSGERTGDGAAGAKASGVLMADGVLYAWVRNTGNSQLAWSRDRARTWQWGFRFEESFGSPAFLNFGRNYAGARDGYVYVYSQDGPSAYESSDGLVLARVRREKIRERSAYEFFARLDESGAPVWTADIARRGPVFRYPGHCQRVDAVYHSASARYLLALGYDHQSGWGIYDAPRPWGPWTVAFHTARWDVPETHGYRLPAKWMSADGRTAWLVFSGRGDYDAFCVRKMEFELVAPGADSGSRKVGPSPACTASWPSARSQAANCGERGMSMRNFMRKPAAASRGTP